MQAWEYKIVAKEEQEEAEDKGKMTNEELNAVGREGWELVSVVTDEQTAVDVGRKVTKKVVVHYFKRPVG